ncbi:hypothetical protein [Winogradskyella aquimaris]|uniref:Lipoprotein n=1 Tax=Winogradskyella aquimaris TaxID=864074 RepID=A0ABU5EUE7_9FLAO|nr:hypothetical protein [Winogradskyella aquimaris]MDY2588434.1 hypothetical protein [Winogradskyella aquimaris]
MRIIFSLLLFIVFFSSCNVTESIVFNDEQSGEYLMTYEMGDAVKAFTDKMGGGQTDPDKKEKGEVMDTTMVFADIMETYKDSIAALPEEKRQAMEAVRDMFMTMKMNEDEGVMDIGIGLNFESLEDLRDIQEKIKKVQNLNGQGDQLDAMKNGSPIGKFMGSDDERVTYEMTANGFERLTAVDFTEEELESMSDLFDDTDENDKEFMQYFEESYYNIKLTFPKEVKSVSFKDAEISSDRKTVTYKANWIDYLKNPLLLDVKVEFVDE